MSRATDKKTMLKVMKWPRLYFVIALLVVVMLLSTALWIQSSVRSSNKTINDLGEFYLEEITERNTINLTSELEKKAEQTKNALGTLDSGYLDSEESIRAYIRMVQQINDLDMMALVDEEGMVYTADSTFSGISRFGFLSEEITQTQIHMTNSFGTKTMVIIAVPANLEEPSNIRITAALTGLNIERIISAAQLQSEENRTYCRLFDREGYSLIDFNGDYPNNENLFDVYAVDTVFEKGFSLEKMKEDWSQGKEGYTVYNRRGAGNTYVYYKSVPGTDLIMTSLMRESVINSVVKTGMNRMLVESAGFMLILLLCMLAMFYIIVFAVKMANIRQRELDQLKILEILSGDFAEVYLVDLAQDEAIALKTQGRMADEKAAASKSYRMMWETYKREYAADEETTDITGEVSAESLLSILKEKEEHSVIYQVKLLDGIHHYQTKFVKLNGEDSRVIAGFRNIDEQVRSEQERQEVLQNALLAAQHANRAKTTFLNNMSHDIRTPMNAIIGFTSLAAVNVQRPERVSEYLTKIQTASSHLMSLINDVLDMSRIESGKVKLEEKPVHLPDLIHDLRIIIQADINSKQLEFYIDAVGILNENVICDRLRVNQILLNLLSNAMKFTQPGGLVGLRIIQRPSTRAGFAEYDFIVKDTGIGISEEFIDHIFEAFTRERNSTVSGIQGTGLGLAITKSIVDIMGGTIRVESQVEKGSEFTVTLPLRVSGEAVSSEPVPELRGLRALVADDDVNTCMSIASMLSVIGMRSEWTTFGKEAVIRAQFAIEQKDEFHAYIIDWLMPDMNGIEVVRRIRRVVGESKPIIILTAYDWTSIEDEAREAGVTAFVSKPIFMSELRELLTRPYIKKNEASEDGAEQYDFSGRRVLLAEDNELNQEIAKELLGMMGFAVEIAGDGSDAAALFAQHKAGYYDLILMDIQMPLMNGYEATRKIRSMARPDAAEIPIVAMTANAFEEDRRLAFEAGMNGHIPKPIENEALGEVISSVLKPHS